MVRCNERGVGNASCALFMGVVGEGRVDTGEAFADTLFARVPSISSCAVGFNDVLDSLPRRK